ncbi:3-dehydrosphinganine reductase [Ophidiomyces ophidiicola]|nr:3-dehydrosphinganine reductase [Ophidiomyces ophidiicola]KAI1985084.1 3-dehydrosphinganine reductase [Ophidiomyces ophidiicola]KAI1986111.1 3-dehydrosphinganine reductase [Ophidiomyces ophidiicola]KAI1995452.1 3-dehydrosphinganine reductase [Ophidiomyces ophidiicola]
MLGFSSANAFEVQGRQTVVITGGSEGMGKSVAIELSRKGANVVIVSRTVAKLEAALKDIKAAALDLKNQRFHFISADLRHADEADRVLTEVAVWNNDAPPDILWCCAGQALPGYFINTPPKTLKDQMDTVYWTAAFTAHATLRKWLTPTASRQKSDIIPCRHLIFTSSVAVFVPITGYAPYSPAKAAMRALSDTLAQEIEVYNGARTNLKIAAPPADVKIHILYPMGILSPGFENEQKIKPELTKLLEEADTPQTPEEVAQIAIKGLQNGDYMITTALTGTLMKTSALGGSPRNNSIRDTILSWISSLAFLYVISDLSSKARHWGRKHGIPAAD